MSWIQKLYETYDVCAGNEPDGSEPLMPMCHTTQQAQIEVVLDHEGNFKRASVLEKTRATTMIPCTESSGGRAGSKPVNHPLADKLQYIAGDFLNFGGQVTSGFSSSPEEPFESFLRDLRVWNQSANTHPKVNAILKYIEQRTLISDLVSVGIIPLNTDGLMQKSYSDDKDSIPEIFKVIQKTQTPEDSFIRWRVEEIGNPASGTWEDLELISAWIRHYQSTQSSIGYCMASGGETTLAIQHPAKIRHGGDKAKLISSNDTVGYTFRGRFIDSNQAVSLGFEVTQKAHNALRWLIQRQSARNGDQIIVSWAISGQSIPDPLTSTLNLLGIENCEHRATSDTAANTAQLFALQLKRVIAGYRSKLDPTEDIVVMGIDSATPGRMAITYYRELKGSDFLERIEAWHQQSAWPQNFGKDKKFIGVPAPRDIADAAYGLNLDEKLRNSAVERLLPCIVDGTQLPRDLVDSAARRTSNRIGFKEDWEWEKCLGIACALFKGYHKERSYQMGLEQERVTRDYLYGRLLAIAENIEGLALFISGENKRDTMAARLMQRFADHPYSTWKTIELALTPYKSRLRVQRSGFLFNMEKLLDEVMCLFQSDNFISDERLTAEFLLGYHCQRHFLRSLESNNSEEKVN